MKASDPEHEAEAPPSMPLGDKLSESGRSARNEREWLRGPLSREVSYRLIVSGELGPKEIGKLIKMLKVQQAVLLDEDGDEDDEDDGAAH